MKDLDFTDPEIQECPYPAYQKLLKDRPVYQDPGSGFYVISRYEDFRQIVRDTAAFSSAWQEGAIKLDPERERRARELFEQEGWIPGPSLAGYDPPHHSRVRNILAQAFAPRRVKAMEPFIRQTAINLVDEFIDTGRCEFVSQFAVPFPALIIARMANIPSSDTARFKRWTDAWIQRFGMMLDENEELECVRKEIEAQRYFMAIFDERRSAPGDDIISDLVNLKTDDGRNLTENELLGHMMVDILVGGNETTTSAFSAAAMILAENQQLAESLNRNPDRIETFIEEVLRLESPLQGIFRVATRDAELCGVSIPKGAIIHPRIGAANRDEHKFKQAETLNLQRSNASANMAFGSGIHACLGAPLARMELYWAVHAVTQRLDDIRLSAHHPRPVHNPSFSLRGLNELNIEFRKRVANPSTAGRGL